MNYSEITIRTNGEMFYEITDQIKAELRNVIKDSTSGVLHIFTTHTSCALTVNESYDPSAKKDMENFLKHLVPRNLSFIEHTDEGPDDSPSHMKSMLLNQSMSFIVDNSELVLGTWQGIYLCEFRDSSKTRKILVKFQKD